MALRTRAAVAAGLGESNAAELYARAEQVLRDAGLTDEADRARPDRPDA